MAHPLEENVAQTWTVKFTEINPLPASQDQLTLADDELGAGTDQGRFDVGITIAFTVAKSRLLMRHDSIEPQEHVVDHIRVIGLIDCDPGRGMRAVDDPQAILDSALLQMGSDQIGDFQKLITQSCFHRKGLMTHTVDLSRKMVVLNHFSRHDTGKNENGVPKGRPVPTERCQMVRLAILGLMVGLASQGSLVSGEEPRKIVERAVEAMGGTRALETESARYMKLEGSVGDGANLPVQAQVRMLLETRTMVGNKANSSGFVEVAGARSELTHITNGNKGWTIDNHKVIEMSEEELKEREQSSYEDRVIGLVSLLEDPEYKLEMLAVKKIQDRPANGIRVSRKQHPDIKLYFDKETGLLTQICSIKKRNGEPGEEITTLGDYRIVDFIKETEKELRAADIPTETKELLRYLDRHTLRPDNLQRVQQRIQQLGDDDFEVREKASAELGQFGPLALPLIRKAVQNPDPEVARRAQEIVKALEKTHNPEMVQKVVRLLGLRKTVEAAQPLLSLVPGANPALLTEIRVALLSLVQNKKVIPSPIEQALQDTNPEIRETAQAVLARDPGKWIDQPGRPLFPDTIKLPHRMTFEFPDKMTVHVNMVGFQLFNRFEDHWFAPPK